MPYINLDIENKHEIIPGFVAQCLHTTNNTIAKVCIAKGSSLPTHQHPHEQITYLISGELMFTINNENKIMQPGMCAVVPSNAPHSATAVKDCVVLDIFSPTREDFKLLLNNNK